MVFLFFTILIIDAIVFMRIKIGIENLKISTNRKGLLNDDYAVYFTVFLLGFIPVFKTKITPSKLQKANIKNKIENSNMKNKINKNNIKMLKILIPEIKKLELKIKFGIEDAAATALTYSILKTVLVNILKKDVEIEAIFNNKNQLNIYLEGIFELKLLHIINKLIIYNRERRDYKNERTSNRRAYAYSHE